MQASIGSLGWWHVRQSIACLVLRWPGRPDQDIYIAYGAEFDQCTGEPALQEDEDGLVWLNGGILLKWADIESLEFMPIPAPGQKDPQDVEG